MTQNSKLTQPNGDPNLCPKRPEDVTQPAQPDTKKLAAEPKENLPTITVLHEPDAPLITTQLVQSASLPREMDPASQRMLMNSTRTLYAPELTRRT